MALKKLKKAEMVRRGQIDHVKAERDVLAGIHNPFIVRLYYSFQVYISLPHGLRVWVHLPQDAHGPCESSAEAWG